ncbi:MAG: hypothetical protein AB7V25_00375 [Mangrovibacterium sp.]
MTARIILEGITYEDLIERITNAIKNELNQIDQNRYRPISKAEACRQLGGIHFNTLKKIMEAENWTEMDQDKIERAKLKYHKSSQRLSLKR